MKTTNAIFNPSLMVRVNYPELGGVMTKKEFIERAKAAGWTVKVEEMSGYQHGDFNRRHSNRLAGEAYEKYEAKMNKTKPVYSIHPTATGSFYDITKTEYQYFQSLCGLDGYTKSESTEPRGYLTRAEVKEYNNQLKRC